MVRYGSLYDSYRLANSQAIPVYTGSAAPEALQVGQYLQGLYDTAQTGAMGISNGLDSMSYLPQDRATAQDLRNRVQGKLDEFAARKDYENLVPTVTKLGQEFANRYRELLVPMQQREQYVKTLDDKELNLTSSQKQALLEMSDAGYKGLQRDANGRLVGKYMGESPDKNIDLNKWVDERLKDIAIQKGGSEVVNSGGQWLIKKGMKWERLSPGTIESAISSAMANAQDVQAYKRMMGRIAGHQASKLWTNPAAFADTITVKDSTGKSVSAPNTVKNNILQVAKQYGIPTSEAAKMVYNQLTQGDIERNAINYATTKYAVDNKWTESDMNANPFALADYAHNLKMKEGIDPYQIQGPDAQLTADERNFNKLSANLKQTEGDLNLVNGQIAQVQRQLQTNIGPRERTQLQTQLTALQEQQAGLNLVKNRADDIMYYSKMQTAQKLGYPSYEAFKNANNTELLSNVKKLYPTGLKTRSGKTISAEQIVDAIVDGRANAYFQGGPRNTGLGSSPAPLAGFTLDTGNGLVSIPVNNNQKGQQLYDLSAKFSGGARMQEFNKTLKDTHEDNVKNYSVSSNYINLSEQERKDISNIVHAGGQGVKLTKPGDYQNPIDEDDRPVSMRVEAIKGYAPDGQTIFSVQGLDKDGKPTEQYEATVSNSNIGMVLGNKWLKANIKGNAPEAARAAETVLPGSGASILATMPQGSRVSGKIDGQPVHISINKAGGKTYYNLVNDDGDVLKTSTGQAFQTTDIGTAGAWLKRIQQ